MNRLAITIFSIVLLQACATPSTKRVEVDSAALNAEAQSQEELFVARFAEDQARLFDLTYQMAVAAAYLCGERVKGFVGLDISNIYVWPKQYRAAAASVLGLSEAVRITHIVPGSPADQADIRVGDIVVEIAGRKIGTGKKAINTANKVFEQMLEKSTIGGRLNRQGQIIERTVIPVAACDSRLGLSLGDEVNAYADGSNVIITRGMLRFASSDEKLATVIAHELAHNAMGHRDKKTSNYLLGTIFDLAAAAYGVNTQNAFGRMGAQAFSKDFESEADYVGIYIMNAAGHRTDEAAEFWRDMGAEFPGSIRTNYTYTHPGAAERYLALEQAASEIRQKSLLGMDVRPTLKNESTVMRENSAMLADNETVIMPAAGFDEVMASFDHGDYVSARAGFESLSLIGNSTATYNLAVMHSDGIGVPIDLHEANRWMFLAAGLGDKDAQDELPLLAERLANSDSEFAAAGYFYLGEAYWNGHGVNQNKDQAVDSYRQGAELDYVPAQAKLGDLYYRGDGVLQQYDLAINWYGRAAASGDEDAMRRVGILIAGGYGAENQKPVGYAILNTLAARDDAEAASLRDSIAQSLQADQLRQGQELSKQIFNGDLDVLKPLFSN